MKAFILPIFAFLFSVNAIQARCPKAPAPKLLAQHFKIEIIDWNHAERFFKGVLQYVRTDHYIKIFNYPGWGQSKHLLFSKRISNSRTSTIDLSNLKLDSLKDFYVDQFVLPTSSEEYTVTYKNSTSYKVIALHHYYLAQISYVIELINDGVPEQFKIRYLLKASSQERTAERMRLRKLFDSTFITLSANKFDHYVDSCTALLKTKKLSEISDSGHIYIILCANTFFYSLIPKSFQHRFVGGRYEEFNNAVFTTSYARNIASLYPDWLSSGSGLYFPQLQILYGGKLNRHSIFEVQDPVIN